MRDLIFVREVSATRVFRFLIFEHHRALPPSSLLSILSVAFKWVVLHGRFEQNDSEKSSFLPLLLSFSVVALTFVFTESNSSGSATCKSLNIPLGELASSTKAYFPYFFFAVGV